MAHKFITVYAVHGDSGGDRSEGPIIAYYSGKSVAEKKAQNSGWYGGYGGVSTHCAIVIDDQVYLLAKDTPIDLDQKLALADELLRVATLASLTAEQKRVLGLNIK